MEGSKQKIASRAWRTICIRVNVFIAIHGISGMKRRKSLKESDQLWEVYSFSIHLLEFPFFQRPLFGHIISWRVMFIED